MWLSSVMLNHMSLGCYISLAAVAICMCWQNDCGREFCPRCCKTHTEPVVPPLQKPISDWAVTATLSHGPCTMNWRVKMNTTKSVRQGVAFRSDLSFPQVRILDTQVLLQDCTLSESCHYKCPWSSKAVEASIAMAAWTNSLGLIPL